MLETPRILAFAGSLRSGSFNKKLVKIAIDAARGSGADVTYLDLRDLPLPVFDQDEEEERGLPENARKLKELFKSHHGFLLSAPEYNSSITGVLKNAIDWASRAESEEEPPLIAFRGKVCALMSASPGGLGGLRGLVHVRAILGNIGVFVLPDQVSIPLAHEAFDENGALKDARMQENVACLGRKLVEIARKLN